jgi:hypothetical protein
MNTFEVIDLLYVRIANSSLKTALTGDVYKLIRLPASNLEDVVINCLPINNLQIQRCTANVNIYVPDISVSSAGLVAFHPDFIRLNNLSSIAKPVLNEVFTATLNYSIEQQSIFRDEISNSHYVNFRIGFNIQNI